MRKKNLFIKRSRRGYRLLGWSFMLVAIFAAISMMNVDHEDEKTPSRTFTEPKAAIDNTLVEYPVAMSTPPASLPRSESADLALAASVNSQNISISQASLRNAVEKWSKAWASKDVPTYLSLYANDYLPLNNVSRAVWVKQRTERIESKKWIRHEIRNLKMQVDGIFAQVKFTQVYADEQLMRTDQKTMRWVMRDGRWWILLETTN